MTKESMVDYHDEKIKELNNRVRYIEEMLMEGKIITTATVKQELREKRLDLPSG